MEESSRERLNLPSENRPDPEDGEFDSESPDSGLSESPDDLAEMIGQNDPIRLMANLDHFLEICRSIEDTPSSLLDDSLFEDAIEPGDPDLADDLDDLRKSLRVLSYFAAVSEDGTGNGTFVDSTGFGFGSQADHSDGPVFVKGRFVLRHPIGRGSYGIVYRAFDLVTQREVALKMPRPELRGIRTVMKRFYREGTSIGKVTHPGLVPLLDMGQDDGTPYLVTRLVNGPNLEQWLDQSNHQLPIHVAARWGEQLAEAVDHLHKKSIVHGDIKPSNILLEHPYEEEILELQPDLLAIRVTDFGNASIVRTASPDAPEKVQGTLCYMAPEQLSPEFRTDVRSDIYAICAVIYEMIAGRPVFETSETRSFEMAIRDEQPVPLRKLRSDTPYALQAIVMKGLSKNPEDRYRSAGELQRDLNASRNLRTPEVLRNHKIRQLAMWLRRNHVVASVMTASIVVIAALALARSYENRVQKRLSLRREAMAWWSSYVDEIDVAKRYLRMNSPRQARAILTGLSKWPDDLHRTDDPREFSWHYLNQINRDRSRKIAGIPDKIYHLCLAFDPAETRIYAGGSDGFLRIVDLDSEKVVSERKIQEGPIQSLALSGDGLRLAVSDPTGVIRIFDTTTYETLDELTHHKEEVTGLAFALDSTLLVSVSIDGYLGTYELKSRSLRFFVSGLPSQDTEPRFAKLGLTILPDGNRVAVAQSNTRIRIFDLTTGEVLKGMPGHFGEVHQIATTTDGKWIVSTGSDLTLAFWDARTLTLRNQVTVGAKFGYVKPPIGKVTKVRKVRSLTSITDSDGQSLVAVDTAEHNIKIYEIPTGIELGQLPGNYASVIAMTWLPKHRKLIAATSDYVMRVWDAPFLEQSIHSDSFELGRGSDGVEKAYFIDVDHEGEDSWEGGQEIQCVRYDPTDFRIERTASAAKGKFWASTAKRIDPQNSRVEVEIRFANAIDATRHPSQNIEWKLVESHEVTSRRAAPSIDGHPDRPYFLVLDSDGRVTHIDLTNPLSPTVRSISRSIDFATFRPDSDEILMIHEGFRKVSVWNFRTGQWAATPIVSTPQAPFVMGEFAGSKDLIALAHVGGLIEIRSLRDGSVHKTIYLPEIGDRRIRQIEFADGIDRMFVAMGFEDLFLLDVLTGKILLHWVLDEREIMKIQLSQDGQSLWVLESPPDVDRGEKLIMPLRRIRRLFAPGVKSVDDRSRANPVVVTDPFGAFRASQALQK
ncbi:protein kinase [bacterium]|nr:protein kinase [bacterium]